MTDNSAALSRIQGADDGTIEGRWNYAQNMAKAGDLIPKGLWASPAPGQPPQPSPGKIMLVHETGRMLGIHPVAALQGVHIIEGRATISPALMSALIRRAGHRLRVRVEGTVEGGDLKGIAEIVRSDDPDFTFRAVWTPQRAQRAGLCKYQKADGVWSVVARSKSGNPLPWEAYTEALVKARAIGEVCREADEGALMGAEYTPEELGALVDEEGEIIEPAAVDWTADIAKVTTRAEGEALIGRMRAAEWFDERAFSTLVARMSVMPSDNPPDQDVYTFDADGNPVDDVEPEQVPAETETGFSGPEDPEPASAPTEAVPTPENGAQRDDPEWTGDPCPACGGNHDPSLHDVSESEPRRRRGFDSSAMQRDK